MTTHRTTILAAASLAVIGLATACATDRGYYGEVHLTEADNGKPVAMNRSQTLVITLPANPTTGYNWTVAAPGTPQLTQDGEAVYTPDASSAGTMGGGGTSTFRFTVAEAGSTTLTLVYSRSFEPDKPPANTFSVPVTVK